MAGEVRHNQRGWPYLTTKYMNSGLTGVISACGNIFIGVVSEVTHTGQCATAVDALFNPAVTHIDETVTTNDSGFYLCRQTITGTKDFSCNDNLGITFFYGYIFGFFLIILCTDVHLRITCNSCLITTTIYITGDVSTQNGFLWLYVKKRITTLLIRCQCGFLRHHLDLLLVSDINGSITYDCSQVSTTKNIFNDTKCRRFFRVVFTGMSVTGIRFTENLVDIHCGITIHDGCRTISSAKYIVDACARMDFQNRVFVLGIFIPSCS